jgi:two-component system, NarL family, invasion response regulator UvrY
MITIAMVDDHKLLRQSLASMIETFSDYKVIIQANNGQELLDMIDKKNLPDIALLDINMPIMDGYETAACLSKFYPQIKIMALSMMDTEASIIRMIKNGAKGFILKDAEPQVLKTALYDLINKGIYYNELVSGKLLHSINKKEDKGESDNILLQLSANEMEFLKFSCTDFTYKEIGEKMNLSARTIDGYRDNLFDKLGCKSRVSLALFAVKQGFVSL